MGEITPSGFTQPTMGRGPVPRRSGLLAARGLAAVRFGGIGEEGVLLMAVLLAMAATRDHRYVAQTHSCGPGTSGNRVHSDVIVSDHPIDFPELERIDLLVTLCRDSTDRHVGLLRPDGILVYESDDDTSPPGFSGASFGVPFARWAVEVTGEPGRAVEIVALGAAVAITGVVSAASLRRAVRNTLGAGAGEINDRALVRGLAIDPAEWRKDGA